MRLKSTLVICKFYNKNLIILNENSFSNNLFEIIILAAFNRGIFEEATTPKVFVLFAAIYSHRPKFREWNACETIVILFEIQQDRSITARGAQMWWQDDVFSARVIKKKKSWRERERRGTTNSFSPPEKLIAIRGACNLYPDHRVLCFLSKHGHTILRVVENTFSRAKRATNRGGGPSNNSSNRCRPAPPLNFIHPYYVANF